RRGGGRRQLARGADLVDGIDAVAAAALGHVERVVEQRLAAEVVVLAGLVGRAAGGDGGEAVLVAGRAAEGAIGLADGGGFAGAAGGDHLQARVVAQLAERRAARALAGVARVADG